MKDYQNIHPGTISMVPAKCGKVNHGVVAVGFVIENNQEFLIVKNKWEQHGVIKDISKFLPKNTVEFWIMDVTCFSKRYTIR